MTETLYIGEDRRPMDPCVILCSPAFRRQRAYSWHRGLQESCLVTHIPQHTFVPYTMAVSLSQFPRIPRRNP